MGRLAVSDGWAAQSGRERIGILGGTFDPPHLGHLILAQSALAGLQLSRILFVLNGDPPHKRGQYVTPAAHRWAMLQAATANNPAFELSRIEIDRPPPYYTYETLRLLRARMPDCELVLLLGGDSLRDIPNWQFPDEIVQETLLGVMQRPGERIYLDVLAERLPEIETRVQIMEAPEVGIAARALRRMVARGQSIRYQVSDAVIAYIAEHRLYEDLDQK
jgi:nicotinate-nucleotide adenylyltransferase